MVDSYMDGRRVWSLITGFIPFYVSNGNSLMFNVLMLGSKVVICRKKVVVCQDLHTRNEKYDKMRNVNK